MKVYSFVAPHFHILSNKRCDAVFVCHRTLYASELIKGRKGGVDTQGLRLKRGQAAFTLTHHWMALCALRKCHLR